METQQRLAVRVLHSVLYDRKSLTAALENCWATHQQLAPNDRANIQNLSFGTLRFWGTIDRIEAALLRKPLAEETIRLLLAVAIFQIQHTRAPSHAIVDHAVKASRHMGYAHLSGLINGVLRNYLRKRPEIEAKAHATPDGKWSAPNWWILRLQRAYPDQWEAILQTSLSPPPLTLRVNQRQTSSADYLQLLQKNNLEAFPIGASGIILAKACSASNIPGFAQGLASVQDYGAQLAAPLLDLHPGQRVLDACAAPGGKTAHILELCNVEVTALDIDERRLQRIVENLQRLHLSANLCVGDAAQPSTWWDGQPFDRILADVPCSASGILRRHPDIKWLRKPEDWPQFILLQRRILHALWGLLAPGGKLLYATCSIFPDENEEQISHFLLHCPTAKRLPLSFKSAGADPSSTLCDQLFSATYQSASDTLPGQLLPCSYRQRTTTNRLTDLLSPEIPHHSMDHDGFFYALLAKAPFEA